MRAIRLLCACAAVLMAGLAPAAAQNRVQPPAPAPAAPYQPVMITPPKPMTDESFEAMRKQLGEAAQRKDRAAMALMVVAQGFFCQRENRNAADKRKSGFDNLSAALGLNNKEGAGWEILSGYAEDPTASPSPAHNGALCAPAEPAFDGKEFDGLIKTTHTDATDWGYPVSAGIDVHAAAQASAPVIDRLGLHFVRIMPESASNPPSYLRIATPSGKPATSRSIRSRRSATTSSATSWTAAPGKSAAMSAAASRSDTPQPGSNHDRRDAESAPPPHLRALRHRVRVRCAGRLLVHGRALPAAAHGRQRKRGLPVPGLPAQSSARRQPARHRLEQNCEAAADAAISRRPRPALAARGRTHIMPLPQNRTPPP